MLLLVNNSVFVKTMIISPTPKKVDAMTGPMGLSWRFCLSTQNTNTTKVKPIPAPTARSK